MKNNARTNLVKTKHFLLDRPLLVVFFILLSLRLSSVDYPLSTNGGDGARDVLIAEYILSGNSVPVGPYSGPFTSLFLNSPAYFYSVAGLLAIGRGIYGLVLVNAVLQVFAGCLLFLIGRKYFGAAAGAVAALSYTLIPNIFQTSQFVWQPNLMAPLLLLSAWFASQAVEKRSFLRAVAAAGVLSGAALMHLSAIPILGCSLVLLSWWSWQQWQSWKKTIGIPLASSGVFLLGMLSVFPYLYQSWMQQPPLSEMLKMSTAGSLVTNLTSSLQFFLSVVGFQLGGQNTFQTILGAVTAITAGVGLARLTVQRKRLKVLGVLLGIISIQLLTASLFGQPTITHYLLPAFLSFCILVPAGILAAPPKLQLGKVAGIFIALLFIATTSFRFSIFTNTTPFSNLKTIYSATDTLERTIVSLRSNPDFPPDAIPQLVSLRTNGHSVDNAVLLIPLEKKMNEKFTRLNINQWSTNYEILNSNESYTILACYDHMKENYLASECLQKFSQLYPEKEQRDTLFLNEELGLYLFQSL